MNHCHQISFILSSPLSPLLLFSLISFISLPFFFHSFSRKKAFVFFSQRKKEQKSKIKKHPIQRWRKWVFDVMVFRTFFFLPLFLLFFVFFPLYFFLILFLLSSISFFSFFLERRKIKFILILVTWIKYNQRKNEL